MFAESGAIEIEQLDQRRIVARLHIRFNQTSAVESPKCAERVIDLKLSGKFKSLEKLGPWDGRRSSGDSLWLEANP